MQIYCEHCGAEIPTQKKISKQRKEMIRYPKVYKMRTCYDCGKKNFIKF